jgi:hypothetical protein
MTGREDCLDEETLLGFIGGALTATRIATLEQHVRDCRVCEERLSAGFAAALTAVDDTGPLPRGTFVGRYTIRTLVGHGGMGEVYAAHDPELDRTIALKLLRSRAGGGGCPNERRLLREAQAVARLSHPNVITVHDVGTHGGRVFLAMEYVQGQTLSAWLAGRARTRAEIVAVFREAARGLAAAHAAGLVHRDFKPQNVMVGDDGVVRVTDFGLARRIDADGTPGADDGPGPAHPLDISLTRTGELVGTPLYMAPEQLRGAPIGPRSDQFGFCVALYEALYGEHPFLDPAAALGEDRSAKLEKLLDALRAGRLRSPPARAGVPSWLQQLLRRGLSARPEDRWPSMDEVIAALGQDARRPRRVAPVAGAALLGAVVAAVGLTQRPRSTAAGPPALPVAAAAPPIAPPPAPIPPPPAPDAPVTVAVHEDAGPKARPARSSGVLATARKRAPVTPTPGAADAPAPVANAGPDVEALLRPAEEQLARTRIVEACALGRVAAERAPQSPAVWEFLGRCYMRMREPDDAIASYRKALELAPDGPRAPFIRAIVDRGGQ